MLRCLSRSLVLILLLRFLVLVCVCLCVCVSLSLSSYLSLFLHQVFTKGFDSINNIDYADWLVSHGMTVGYVYGIVYVCVCVYVSLSLLILIWLSCLFVIFVV